MIRFDCTDVFLVTKCMIWILSKAYVNCKQHMEILSEI